MAVNLSPVGGVAAQFFDNNGVILTGGKIYTYTAGTTTPQTTYTSSSGATAHSNPIILDASGRVPGGEIWLTDGLSYKFVIKDANEVLIGTYDNVVGINSNFINYTIEQEIQTATAGQTVFTLTTTQYQPGTNSLSVFVDGVNQYGPGAQYAYVETSSTVITFVTGLHVGASVKFTIATINSSSYGDAFQISYTPPYVDSVATNVGDKLAQTVSVMDFGAVGDGVADDTAAIQAAINACSNKTLYFPGGTYLTNELTGVANITLIGDGNGASVLKATGSIASGFLFFFSVDNIHISNLTFDYNSATSVGTVGCLGFLNCDNFKVQNCQILNFVKVGIGMNSCNYFWIQNNYISKTTPDLQGVNECILLSESGFGTSSYGWIENNRFVNSGLLLQGSYLNIIANNITDWRYGAGIGIGQTATSFFNSIIGNHCESGYTGLDSDGFTVKGMEIWGGYNKVIGNTCRSNSGSGIYLGGANSVLQNNICFDNGTYTADVSAGITLGYFDATYNASNSVVSGNVCFDNQAGSGTQDYGIAVAANNTRITIVGNNLINNRVGEILATETQTFIGQNITAQVTWDPASISNNASTTQAITVANASLGDVVTCSCSTNLLGLSLTGYVSQSNQVIIVLTNNTGSPVDIGSSVFRVVVSKPLF
jgi:parallel beta-helix repeat protein